MNRRYDVQLLILSLGMVLLGLAMVYSASSYQDALAGRPYAHLLKQAVATGMGLACMRALAVVPYRKLGRFIPWIFGLGIAALLLVWVPGVSHSANGATRWFRVLGMSFQPAEFVKMGAVVTVAWWMARNRGRADDPVVLGTVAVGLALPLALILMQPDFGSFAVICVLSFVVVVLAGLPLAWIAGLGGLGALGLAVVAIAEPYRVKRLTSFLDPFQDCSGDGYQVCQSLLAFHHGGVVGQGLGASVAKLEFLPEPHNDFIAAVYGEETGLIGMFVLFALYAAFAWRGYRIATTAPDLFGALLAQTFTIMIVGQACMNLGVALSMVPPKGLVLPFMSYGASAMIVNLAAVGVMLSVSAEATQRATSNADERAPGQSPALTGA